MKRHPKIENLLFTSTIFATSSTSVPSTISYLVALRVWLNEILIQDRASAKEEEAQQLIFANDLNRDSRHRLSLYFSQRFSFRARPAEATQIHQPVQTVVSDGPWVPLRGGFHHRHRSHATTGSNVRACGPLITAFVAFLRTKRDVLRVQYSRDMPHRQLNIYARVEMLTRKNSIEV